MEASYDFSDRSWYRPGGQTQAGRMAMRGVTADYSRSHSRSKPTPVIPPASGKSGLNTRTHYQPAQNAMESSARAPHYQRARHVSHASYPSEKSATTASISERYLIPKSKSSRPQRAAKQLPSPVAPVYVRVNELDMSRSWYIPKRPTPVKNMKKAGGIPETKGARKSRAGKDNVKRSAHAASSGHSQDTQQPGGLVKGWYGAFRKMFFNF